MGSGFSKMRKQARMMQTQMDQMKETMQQTLIEGSAGGGLVTVTLNGEKDLKKIRIQPEVLTDIDGLQDLIVAAFESASQKIEEQREQATPRTSGF